MTYSWSDFRRLLNRVTSIGPWICHNALRHMHGTTLFLKGKNDTCLFYRIAICALPDAQDSRHGLTSRRVTV